MRSTFKILFYINRGKVKTDGTTGIMCRISIDGKTSVLATGIYCQPKDWNTKKGEIKTEKENKRLTVKSLFSDTIHASKQVVNALMTFYKASPNVCTTENY